MFAEFRRLLLMTCQPACAYGGVINRIGTGDVPDAGIGGFVAVLLHPATFSTVTLRLPLEFAWLMKTCRNPTIVIVGLLVNAKRAP